MKEQGKNPPDQTNEEETGSLPEKETGRERDGGERKLGVKKRRTMEKEGRGGEKRKED